MSATLKWYGDAIAKKIHMDIGDKVEYACLQVVRDAKLSFGPRHKPGTSTPSAPGQPPAVTTGTLRRSIAYEVDKPRAVGRVGTNLVYARIQEMGGLITAKSANFLHFVIDGKHKMVQSVYLPARPYLRPALDKNEGFIARLFGRKIV